ncbi:MAG: NAD(+) diphosphatase [Xanthomonadales bacterium]
MGRPPGDPETADEQRLSLDPSSRSRHNRFTSIPLDRFAEHRDDADWLAAARASTGARFVPLWRGRCLLDETGAEPRPVYLDATGLAVVDADAPCTLLGGDGRHTWFAVALDDGQRDRLLQRHAPAAFRDLRGAIDLEDRHAGVLAYARALLYWHYRHAHCGSCGAPTRVLSAGHRLVCSRTACAREFFPRIDPAMIVLVTHEDACLLGHNPRWPERRYSTLAGYVEPGESLEDAVAREVYEEARVRLADVRYRSSQPWPFPASLMCGFRATARNRECRPSDELEHLLWLTATELREAVRADRVRLPPPLSIAFRLIAEWYTDECGADLEPLVRDAGGWLPRKRLK